ncbi:MAG TPA: enolase C-terminal domain-like protein [Gemmatimonadaceae bacterium]|jgi:L-alanine-DL-glutamate epimerase-like enolase superfamily enzyme
MKSHSVRDSPVVDGLTVSAYRIPTDSPESDGTFEWNSTTVVLVELSAADTVGIGYTYADLATAKLIEEHLRNVVTGCDPRAIPGVWEAMRGAVRNVGRPGLASAGIAAVDTALWDLKAKLIGVPLYALLGAVRDRVPVYGSGGFTSYSLDELSEQLGGWVESGIRRVKMKVGREPSADVERVRAAREAIGSGTELFVDANGAYSRKQALAFAERFAECGVSWFEEPVSSDDLEGLRVLRDRVPAGMEIAAGEYGYDLVYFRRMLDAGAVDVLQADATRCAGISEFLRVGALCAAHGVPLSAHTAPSLHLHVCCALTSVRHIEYFHDHARLEQMLFDGASVPVEGALRPDCSRPGLGLELKRADAARYAV